MGQLLFIKKFYKEILHTKGGNVENLFDTKGTIHDKIIKTLIKPLKNEKVKKILDAGSGKTSASILLKYFPEAEVDAVIYPGDNRKKNPLETAIGSNRLNVEEADICEANIKKNYDLCVAHLTLGEATNFGNSFEKLFHKIVDMRAKHFIIIDIWEDPCVHYRYIEQYLKEKGFKIIIKKKFRNPHPEHYPKVKYDKYKLEFDSHHYMSYLIRKI